jgi:WD40 repeat protein
LVLVGLLALMTCPPATSGPSTSEKAPAPKKPEQSRTDRYGDPLPDGAIARLGTARFRSFHTRFALSADGKTLALEDYDSIRLCDMRTGKDLSRLKTKGPGDAFSRMDLIGLSPDGKTLATAERDAISLWNAASGKRLWRSEKFGIRPKMATFGADGKSFLTLGDDEWVILVWDAATGKLLREQVLPVDGTPYCRSVSADGRVVAAATDKHTVTLLEVTTAKKLHTLSALITPVDRLVLSPTGQALVSLDKDQRICHVWDVATGKKLHAPAKGAAILALALSPHGKTLALAHERSIFLWDARTGKQLQRLAASVEPDSIGGLAEDAIRFSADGKTLLVQDRRAVRVWEVTTGKELHALPGHTDEIYHLAFSADGKTLATGSMDGVRIWETATGRQLQQIRAGKVGVAELALAADGKTVASYDPIPEITVHVWDAITGRERHRFPQVPVLAGNLLGNYGITLCLSPDGKKLAVSSITSSEVDLWDITRGRLRRHLKWQGYVHLLALSPDGKTLAIGGLPEVQGAGGDAIELWDAVRVGPRGTPLLPAADDKLDALVFSGDGRMLAGLAEKTIRLWEIATGKPVHRFKGSEDWAAVAFTPAGRVLAVRGERGKHLGREVTVWDVLAGKVLHRLQAPAGTCFCEDGPYGFSPDGSLLATAMEDTTALVWDLRSPDKRSARRPARLGSKDLERHWTALAGDDAARAYRAVQSLTTAPDEAVPLLKGRLKPVPAEHYTRLIVRLDDARFSVREAASRQLAELGLQAEPALVAALGEKQTPEARNRLRRLLAALHQHPLLPERLRQIRAVQVLEQIGSPASLEVLQAVAQGAPEASLTQEAKASLERLARGP